MKQKNKHLILPFIVFAVIAVYLAAQIFLLASNHTNIDVETVSYGTVDTPQIYTGLVLREECVVNSTRAGKPFYQYSQGDYVSKGSVVCTVKEADTTEKLEIKLDEIDKSILKTQKTRADLSIFSEDIARLEDNMGRTVDAYAGRSMKSNVSYMYTMKSQIESYMEQRNEIWLTENIESLSQLTQEKNLYAQQLAQSQSAVEATEAGILCLSYDGLEEKYYPDMADKVTKKEIGETKVSFISKSKSVQEGDPLFKIIKSNQWHIVAFFPNTETVSWKVSQNKMLNLLVEGETIPVEIVIESIQIGEKETKVVFSSYSHMDAFMEERTVSFSMEGSVAEGLKIPTSAMVEKALIGIPRDCLTESTGNDGVLLVNGSRTRFMDISIMAGDEKMVYIEQNEGSVQVGDLILRGNGESAETYLVSKLKTHKGVYVANSSVANFVPVEVLEQNQEYAVVEVGNVAGLQPYDTIVSDAKNIMEGQRIY